MGVEDTSTRAANKGEITFHGKIFRAVRVQSS
jgi:hypothetical protein